MYKIWIDGPDMLQCNHTARLEQECARHNPTAPLQECSSTITPMFCWLRTALLQHHCSAATLLLCCKNALLCNTAALLQHRCSTATPLLYCNTSALYNTRHYSLQHHSSVATSLVNQNTAAPLQHHYTTANPLLHCNTAALSQHHCSTSTTCSSRTEEDRTKKRKQRTCTVLSHPALRSMCSFSVQNFSEKTRFECPTRWYPRPPDSVDCSVFVASSYIRTCIVCVCEGVCLCVRIRICVYVYIYI